MSHLDASCFSGAWPFHKTRRDTLEKVAELHRANGIEGGLVSSVNAIFWNDPWEAELDLAEELKDYPNYTHVLTVNPTLPGYLDDLNRAVKSFPVAGVRVYPGFHAWKLSDKAFLSLWDFLREHGLPLFLTLRMEDERVTYLFHPQTVPVEEIPPFLKEQRGFPVVLSNIRDAELVSIAEAVLARPDVFADTAGFKGALFFLDNVADTELPERMVFGSLSPIFCLQSTKLVVETSLLSENRKEHILSCACLNH